MSSETGKTRPSTAGPLAAPANSLFSRLADGRRLILASASETRRAMLTAAGIEHEAVATMVDEEALRQAAANEGISGIDTATLLAEAKALQASRKKDNSATTDDALILGADQLLECEGRFYGKPENMAAAKHQLAELAGKQHQLLTAAVMIRGERRLWHHAEIATITLRPLDSGFIDAYINALGTTALQTPGLYQTEGLGAQIIARMEGCGYSILGLPLLQILDFLRKHGLQPVAQS